MKNRRECSDPSVKFADIGWGAPTGRVSSVRRVGESGRISGIRRAGAEDPARTIGELAARLLPTAKRALCVPPRRFRAAITESRSQALPAGAEQHVTLKFLQDRLEFSLLVCFTQSVHDWQRYNKMIPG